MSANPDFKRILDRCFELVPHLDMQPGRLLTARRLILEWLALPDIDPDRDILHTMNVKRASTTAVFVSAAIFDQPIRRAREERLKLPEARKRADEAREKNIRWRQSHNMHINYHDEQWIKGRDNGQQIANRQT